LASTSDDEETTVVNLQSREDIDWLRAVRDDEEEDADDVSHGQE
jgi:hypothetical protein